MKLKKKICKKCIAQWAKINKGIAATDWRDVEDEKYWKDGQLSCMYNDGLIDIDKVPPVCKFMLEQMVIQNDDKDK